MFCDVYAPLVHAVGRGRPPRPHSCGHEVGDLMLSPWERMQTKDGHDEEELSNLNKSLQRFRQLSLIQQETQIGNRRQAKRERKRERERERETGKRLETGFVRKHTSFQTQQNEIVINKHKKKHKNCCEHAGSN